MPIPTDLIDATLTPASVATACTAAITVSMTPSAPQPVARRTRAAIPPDGSTITASILVPPTSSPTLIGRPSVGRRLVSACASALDRPGDEATGHAALNDQEEDDDGDRDQRRRGHELRPVDAAVRVEEGAQPHRKSHGLGARVEYEREHELVP